MTILTYFLTVILVLDCLLLGLLVLVQLPKKEAGVGMAFGGGTADALFGPGSGTALSKLTKYAATIFFALVFIISLLNTHARHSDVSDLRRAVQKESAMPLPTAPVAAQSTPAPTPAGQAPAMNLTIASSNYAPAAAFTNAPVPATTNK